MSERDVKNIETINELIRDISRGAAFSADAMAQFVELQSEVDSLENTNKFLREKADEQRDEIKKLERDLEKSRDKVGDLNSEMEGFRTRISELEDREKQCAINEVRMECANVRVDDHQNMVGLIFRNTELRKKFTGQEMHHSPGCIEIRDEYGNIKQYAEQSGFVGVPIEKTETETEE